jgi:hypothetical protein
MSGPNPPDEFPGGSPTEESRDELTDTGFSRAYSAPESEQYAIAPYIPADLELYDYDSYDQGAQTPADLSPPKWPWVVGITAIIAAISLVASVALLVTRTDASDVASSSTTTSGPPIQDEITTPPPPPPPPPPTPEAVIAACDGALAWLERFEVALTDDRARAEVAPEPYLNLGQAHRIRGEALTTLEGVASPRACAAFAAGRQAVRHINLSSVYARSHAESFRTQIAEVEAAGAACP